MPSRVEAVAGADQLDAMGHERRVARAVDPGDQGVADCLTAVWLPAVKASLLEPIWAGCAAWPTTAMKKI